MKRVIINEDDVTFRYTKREDGTWNWDIQLLHKDGTWSEPLKVETTGADLLWQVSLLTYVPS